MVGMKRLISVHQDHVSIKLENTENFIISAVFPALCIHM